MGFCYHIYFYRYLKFVIAISLFGLNSTFGIAQSPDVKFTYLAREDALLGVAILKVYQDHKGYMWFGTDDGLNKFDGFNFSTYKNANKNINSISNNFIRDITEDKKKRIWIATSYGLNLYNRKKDDFTNYIHSKNDSKSISSNFVNTIYEGSDGTILVGTSLGLNLFDEQHNHFRRYINTSTDNITSLLECEPGIIWVGTSEKGIRQFDLKSGSYANITDKFKNLTVLNKLHISTIKRDMAGNIWIGTLGRGVFKFSPKTGTVKNFKNQENDRNSLSNNVIKSILCDRTGNVWIGIENGGVNLWLSQSEKFIRYEYNPSKANTLSQKSALSIYEDIQGNIWVGTVNGGINIYSPHKYKFDTYRDGIAPNTLSYRNTKAFLEDDDGTIWIGTDGGGINLWNRTTNTFTQYRHHPKRSNTLGSDAILTITKDSKGTIWVGTWGGGLNRYNRDDRTFTRFINNPNDKNTISSNHVYNIYEDKKYDQLWIATTYGGLNLFNLKSLKFRRVTKSSDGKTAMLGENVGVVNEDREGNLWIGTNSRGITSLSANRKRFLNYFSNTPKGSIDNYRVIFLDSKKRLWVGAEGLYLYNEKRKNFSLYSSNSYLSHGRIMSMNEDNNGNLWIGTSYGLLKLNPQSQHLERFTDKDGLQGLEFSQNASLKTSDGLMLFGGTEGFNTFYPDKISNANYTYPVYITGLQVFNRRVKHGIKGSPIENHISEAKKIVLNYKQSLFSIGYAALNYVSPSKTQYAYILKGFDIDWNYVGTQRTATYNNLDPGKYTFLVKASSPDGGWNIAPASIEVIINPPFWLTWWFKSLAFVAFLSSAIFIITRVRKAELRVLNEQKREEIHQIQLQFFTNISHEFRTPLSLILGPLEQVLKQDSNPQLTHYFHTMQRNANRLMHLISELMDFRKVESGALKLRVMQNSLSAFITEIAQEFKDQAIQQNINFSVKHGNDDLSVWFDRQVVEKILLNLVHNSFKYTPDNGSISIEVLSSIDNYHPPFENSLILTSGYKAKKYIYISITDSGIGISKNSINHLFERYYRITNTHLGSGVGLAFVKSLAFLHKGNINVYSEQKKGTNIIISIPCSDVDYTESERWYGTLPESGVHIESVNYKAFQPLPTYKTVKPTPSIAHYVLIVDDNEELRNFIKEILEPYYLIIEAGNGQEGILKARDESPALIISDVMMPVMDGIKFCSEIKSNIETSHIPFILLTAKDALGSRLQGAESGADYYFSKPVSTELLLLTIKNIFEQRQIIKERYLKDYQIEIHELVHSTKDKDFLNKLLLLLENNLNEPDLNVEYLCEEIGMSKTILQKKLKSITGQTINEFIRTIRLKKAVELMTNEDLLITEVMYRVGILSPSYFSTIFKREFGITPSEFQKKIDAGK